MGIPSEIVVAATGLSIPPENPGSSATVRGFFVGATRRGGR